MDVAPPRKKLTFKDFERLLANNLRQADYSLLESSEDWLFAVLDDYPRYFVGAQVFADRTGENALTVIQNAVRQYGSPFQLMTDHGAQFLNNKTDAPNSFSPVLKGLGINHILAGVKRPQTNCKIERWFGCFKSESPAFSGLSEYLYHYNFCRPQGGIYYRKPNQRFFAFRL